VTLDQQPYIRIAVPVAHARQSLHTSHCVSNCSNSHLGVVSLVGLRMQEITNLFKFALVSVKTHDI